MAFNEPLKKRPSFLNPDFQQISPPTSVGPNRQLLWSQPGGSCRCVGFGLTQKRMKIAPILSVLVKHIFFFRSFEKITQKGWEKWTCGAYWHDFWSICVLVYGDTYHLILRCSEFWGVHWLWQSLSANSTLLHPSEALHFFWRWFRLTLLKQKPHSCLQ